MEREAEILHKLQVEMNGIKLALEAKDVEMFYACVEDLETLAREAVKGRWT